MSRAVRAALTVYVFVMLTWLAIVAFFWGSGVIYDSLIR